MDYAPGTSNVVADALSRHPSDYRAPCPIINGVVIGGCSQPAHRCLPTLSLCALLGTVRSAGEGSAAAGEALSWKDKFVQGYAQDPWFQDKMNVEGLFDFDGFLLKEGKAVVPDALGLRAHILKELHDSPYAGHQGVKKTLALVRRHYWWPTMLADIERYVLTCHLCQKNKARNTLPAGLLQPLQLPLNPWHTVTMDFITQLPKTARGHDAIFVVVDKLTKMVHLMPTTTKATAEQTAKLYAAHVWKLHGVPQVVVSDRDKLFTSHFARALCESIGTQQAMSTAYHPQTDGQTERVNRVLEDMLRMYVAKSQDDWDEKLVCAEFAINNSDHESTGSSPFLLNYGFHPHLPVAILPNRRVPGASDFVQGMQRLINEARMTHRVATARQAQYANTKRRDVQFGVGDWVLLSSKNLRFKVGTPKLLPRWVGPFQVVKRVGTQAYELDLPARWRIHDVFHVSNLERYRRDGSMQPPPPAEVLEGEDEYEVEALVDHRRVNSRGRPKYEYLVHWKGYSSEHDTWEEERNLANAPTVVKGYWDTVNARAPRGKARRRG